MHVLKQMMRIFTADEYDLEQEQLEDIAREAESSNKLKRLRHAHARASNRTPEYNAWVAMHARCRHPKHPDYKYYGGRGISVCDRWTGVSGFQNFLEDMGRKPEPAQEYSLDRIDNSSKYEPGNCRWATWKEQAGNRRNPVPLVIPQPCLFDEEGPHCLPPRKA